MRQSNSNATNTTATVHHCRASDNTRITSGAANIAAATVLKYSNYNNRNSINKQGCCRVSSEEESPPQNGMSKYTCNSQ